MAELPKFPRLKGNWIAGLDFRPEVEIRPFCACAMKTLQYCPYLWPNWRNVR